MMANASTNGNDECIKNEDLVRSYATFSEQMSNVADSVNRMERFETRRNLLIVEMSQ